MKNLFKLVALIIVTLSLFGCGNSVEKAPSSTQNGENNQESENNQGGEINIPKGELTEKDVRNHKVAKESDFEYDDTVGGVRIWKYTGSDTIVVIPESINGKKVVEIGGLVFANDSNVRGVLIPSGVKEIAQLFTNNDDLEVVISENIEEIGYNTFNNCISLHTVVLGDKLTKIGENAFFGCDKLKELYISPSVTQIDESIYTTVFFWCHSLTIIGEKGSFIESFCAENDIPFRAK